MLRKIKWLYPGLNIKRWIFAIAFGIFLIIFASLSISTVQIQFLKLLDIFLIILGCFIIYLGIRSIIKTILKAFLPGYKHRPLIDLLIEQQHLIKGPKIVAIGGGTGLSSLLAGIKEYTTNITAVVTVADDGGSSGRLREEFNILPPGDIRNCLVALAEAEPLMRKLFQFRFNKNSQLKGHNFGNLFITAMTQLTGDFEKALKESSKVLAIRGEVIPSTLNKIKLLARFKDGKITEGEANIPKQEKEIDMVFLRPVNCQPNVEALRRIREADIIILGPGSLFTSILPNLLIKEITQEIVNARALKIYICNIMTQHGETDNFRASDHLKALIAHTHPRIVEICVVNTGKIPEEYLKKYEKEKSYPVIPDVDVIKNMGYKVVEGDFLSLGDFVRHNSKKLAQKIIEIYINERR